MSEQRHPLLFATNNSNKALEVNHILGNSFKVLSLKDAGIEIDIAEPHATLEANAREKSMTIYTLKNIDCFSEDTGLEVEALGGAPGVKSARFAGEPSNTEANIKKLLGELQNKENRKAQFRTVISLVQKGVEKQFEGVCKGHITLQPIGENGFGYDPIFVPQGLTKTSSELSDSEKDQISHRGIALRKISAILKQLPG